MSPSVATSLKCRKRLPAPSAVVPLNSRVAVIRQARVVHAHTANTRFNHVYTRAFCVAKPVAHCAVFTVPPCDNEPQVPDTRYVTVQNASVQNIQAGDWAALTYMSEPRTGQFVAMALPSPKGILWRPEYRQGKRWKAVAGQWVHMDAAAICNALVPVLGVNNVRVAIAK